MKNKKKNDKSKYRKEKWAQIPSPMMRGSDVIGCSMVETPGGSHYNKTHKPTEEINKRINRIYINNKKQKEVKSEPLYPFVFGSFATSLSTNSLYCAFDLSFFSVLSLLFFLSSMGKECLHTCSRCGSRITVISSCLGTIFPCLSSCGLT